MLVHFFHHRFGAAGQAEILSAGDAMVHVEQMKRLFHSSRVKCLFVNMSTSWCLVSTFLIWIFGFKLVRLRNEIKSISVGSGNMSHCRASSLADHLDHCFVVFKHIQQSFLTRRIDVGGTKINIVFIINHSTRFLSRWKFVRCCTN